MSAPPLALWEEQLALGELRRLAHADGEEGVVRRMMRMTGAQRRLMAGAARGIGRERDLLQTLDFDGRAYGAVVAARRRLRARGRGLDIDLVPLAGDGPQGNYAARILRRDAVVAEGRDGDPERAIARAMELLADPAEEAVLSP